MSRLSLLMVCLGLGLVLVRGAAAQPPTNVVLIVADDLGYGDVASYGAADVRTPQIDRLAAEGMRFTQFRVNPLCAPTRASLLSGLYSLETGMWRGPSRRSADADTRARELRRDVRLLPQYMQEAGYATGMFGKWHLGYEAPNVPNARGFSEFVGFLGGAHPYEAGRGETILRNGTPIEDERHLTDLFTEEAVAFIEAHRGEPFFCYVAYNAVHGPLWSADRPRTSGKKEWLDKAARRGVELPRRDYCAVLEHMDDCVGQIVESLRRAGVDERTLVVFISDNGALEDKYPGNNGPFRGQKGETYEGGIRVPAVARWPGVIPPGSTSDAPAMVFDLFATCLEAAGLGAPQTNGSWPVHGISLVPHLRSGGEQPLPDRYLFWDLWGKLGAYHDGWKLVGDIGNHRGRFAEAAPKIADAKFELYYLPDDAGETRDLAGSRPHVYMEMKERLQEWFRRSTR